MMDTISDNELAGWARNWHWNDCVDDRPVDPSIYFRDMRMLKAFITRFDQCLPQYFSNCLRAGACHGKCESTACTNYGKDIVVRRCVEDCGYSETRETADADRYHKAVDDANRMNDKGEITSS